MIDNSLLELGTTFVISLGLLEIIKVLVGFLYKKNGSLSGMVNQIANNDLVHIYDELVTINNKNNKMIEVLIEIKTILQERKN